VAGGVWSCSRRWELETLGRWDHVVADIALHTREQRPQGFPSTGTQGVEARLAGDIGIEGWVHSRVVADPLRYVAIFERPAGRHEELGRGRRGERLRLRGGKRESMILDGGDGDVRGAMLVPVPEVVEDRQLVVSADVRLKLLKLVENMVREAMLFKVCFTASLLWLYVPLALIGLLLSLLVAITHQH
jgi:hypothetical protein